MNRKRVTDFRPDQIVDDVFRVCNVTKRFRATDRPYFVLTLADDRGKYEAITGWQAAELVLGDAVRVRDSVVRRGDKLVLVARFLRSVDWQTHCTGSVRH